MKNHLKKVGRVLATVLALVLTIGVAGAEKAYAGAPFSDLSPTQVNYRHVSGHNYEVQDPDWVQVYCLDPAKGYSDNKANQNFRWKFDFWATPGLLDKNEGDVNGSYKPASSQLNRLVSILWKAEQMGANIDDTQNAVWWFVTNGGDDDYAGSPSSYNNDIVKAAGDSGWAMPASFSLYFYAADLEADSYATIQNMVRLQTAEPETWTIKTKAGVQGKGTASEGSPLVITLDEGQESTGEITIFDTILYSGMTPGTTYEVQTKFMQVNDDGSATELRDRAGDGGYIGGFKAEAAEGEWKGENLTFYGSDLKPGKYVFFESVRNTATGWVVDHKDVNDAAQTIIVKSAGDDTPGNDDDTPSGDDRAPSMKTSVSVNDKTGSPLEITGEEALEVTEVKDTVNYKGLLTTAEYTISGKLVKVAADGTYDAESPVSEASVTFTPDAADGSEVLTFPVSGGLDLDSTYVVLETMTCPDDDKIPAEGLVHPETVSESDEDAKAQMIKTGKIDAPITPQGNPEEETGSNNNSSNNSNTGNSSTSSTSSSTGSRSNTSTGNTGDKVSNATTGKATAPKTGDTNNMLPYLAALLAASTVMAVLIRKRRSI